MIGQKTLLNEFRQLKEKNRFPHFCITCGKLGSGKHTISLEIAKLLDSDFILVDNKIDNIRDTIDMIYNTAEPTIYIFENADDMSVNAKNVLLKVCEEPPKTAYIILLVESLDNVLDTIKSRAQIFQLTPYTKQELTDFAQLNNYTIKKEELDFIECPGDIIRLQQNNNKNILTYTQKVVDNLHRVSISNGLKITKSVKTTKTAESGFDIDLFLNALEVSCKNKYIQTKDSRFISFGEIVANNKIRFARPSINKSYELDNIIIKGWLLWNYQN